jgi:predicted TPR repeat methyltransferase
LSDVPPGDGPVQDADKRIIGIYSRHASAFVRKRSRALFEKPWLDRFLAVMPLEPAAMPHEAAVLDLGCGFGEPLGGYLIAAGCDVTGVDTSAELLAIAAARFPDQAWIQADMRTLGLGRRFHGVLAWDSFFHLTPQDQREMFSVFRAHLLDGGVLMFTSGPTADVRIGEYEGEPLYHASLGPDEYRALLARQGFDVLSHRPEDPDCGGHTVWLARLACQ